MRFMLTAEILQCEQIIRVYMVVPRLIVQPSVGSLMDKISRGST